MKETGSRDYHTHFKACEDTHTQNNLEKSTGGKRDIPITIQ